MQAGLRRIVIEDVTVIVKQNMDDFAALQKAMADWPEDEALAQGRVREVLVGAVRTMQGMEDVDGQPVTRLTAENVGSMSMEFVMSLFTAVCSPGGVPKAASGENSAASSLEANRSAIRRRNSST